MNRILLSALIVACFSAVGLTAQTQERQADLEVVVTAGRVEEPAESIPAYVTVITAEQLTAAGQTTLVDALQGVVGVHFRSTSGNAAQAEVSMRGFGENSHGRVLVLLDGRRLNRPDMASANWLEIPIESIERVEIVRGGASVLYGDNAVAGVINIITRKQPADRFGFRVSGQYGCFNQNQERVEVNGPLGPLAVSANVEHSATDGYRQRSAYRSLGGGLNLGLESEALRAALGLSYSRLFYELPGALTKAEFEADPTQAGNLNDESNNHYANADLGLSYSPGERLLVDANLGYGLKAIQSDIPSNFVGQYSDAVLQTVAVTPKVRLSSDLLAGNRLLFGVDGYYDLLSLKRFTDAGRTETTDEYDISKLVLGLYVSDELSVLRFLSLSAGVRYEAARIAVDTLKTSGTAVDDSSLLQSFVYNAGILFNPYPGSKSWVRYATVFRYPFVDELIDLYGFLAEPFNTVLAPERGHSLEVGMEAPLFKVVKVGGNAFWLEMQDEIAYDSGANLNVNLDKTRHLGVEAEVSLHVPDWLDVTASYALTVATFREGVNAGKLIPLVPRHAVTGQAVLRLPLGVSLGGSARYVGPMYSGGDYDNSLEPLEDYWLLDLSVRYQPKNLPADLDLYLGIENLVDARYATAGYYGSYYPGTGRSLKAGASYRY